MYYILIFVCLMILAGGLVIVFTGTGNDNS